MFNTIFYQPIYNLLAFVLSYVPMHDVGISVVVVTLIIKFALYPLSKSAAKSTHSMKKVEDKVKALKEKHKDTPQLLGQELMVLYKEHNIKPFSAILGIIIQIPILIALYFVFSKGFVFESHQLYSFVSFPENLHTLAFGIIDMTKPFFPLALLVGVSAYLLARRQMGHIDESKLTNSFGDQFQKSLKMQMIYVFPVMFIAISAFLPSVLSVYWLTSNIFSYLQDIKIKKELI